MDENQLRGALNKELAGFFGKLNKRLDTIDATKADRTQVEKLQNTMDGIASNLASDETEHAAITNHQARQDGWIHQLADATNTRLVPEQ